MRTRYLASLFAAIVTVPTVPLAAQNAMPSLVTLSPDGPVVNLGVRESDAFAPDIATIRIAVTTRGTDRQKALDENSRAMEKVAAAIDALGISDDDVETDYFSVRNDYDWEVEGGRIRGVVVNNSYVVTVRDFALLPKLAVNTVAAGATDIGSPDFDLADRTPVMDMLTERAMARAKARARFHAKLAGYSDVKLLSITDSVENQPFNSYKSEAVEMAAEDVGGQSGPTLPRMDPEEVDVAVRLMVSYEMTR